MFSLIEGPNCTTATASRAIISKAVTLRPAAAQYVFSNGLNHPPGLIKVSSAFNALSPDTLCESTKGNVTTLSTEGIVMSDWYPNPPVTPDISPNSSVNNGPFSLANTKTDLNLAPLGPVASP